MHARGMLRDFQKAEKSRAASECFFKLFEGRATSQVHANLPTQLTKAQKTLQGTRLPKCMDHAILHEKPFGNCFIKSLQ